MNGEFKEGDIVTVHLDMDDCTLRFQKNEEWISDAITIPRTSYRLLVNLSNVGDR